jgi:hypothetical protein
VLLPTVGTFVVGQALEDRFATYKRWRPTFGLLDGRFGGVSQERSRFRLLSECALCCAAVLCCAVQLCCAVLCCVVSHLHCSTPEPVRRCTHTRRNASTDRSAVVQLNFQLISQDAQVHRSIAQRLINEMLQRLAMHIVGGHAIKVRVSACVPPAGQ